MQVGDVEAPTFALGDVARVAPHALVAPEQNASSPSPVRMIAPTAGSSRASSSACEISTIVCGRKALRTSGRLIVIFAIPSPVVS